MQWVDTLPSMPGTNKIGQRELDVRDERSLEANYSLRQKYIVQKTEVVTRMDNVQASIRNRIVLRDE